MINVYNKDTEERFSLVQKFDSMLKQAYEENSLESWQVTHNYVIKMMDSRQEQSMLYHQTLLNVAVDKISNLIASKTSQQGNNNDLIMVGTETEKHAKYTDINQKLL